MFVSLLARLCKQIPAHAPLLNDVRLLFVLCVCCHTSLFLPPGAIILMVREANMPSRAQGSSRPTPFGGICWRYSDAFGGALRGSSGRTIGCSSTRSSNIIASADEVEPLPQGQIRTTSCAPSEKMCRTSFLRVQLGRKSRPRTSTRSLMLRS